MKTYGTKKILPVYGDSRPVERRINNKKIAGWEEQQFNDTLVSQTGTYNDSAFLKINGKSVQTGTPTPTTPIAINNVSNFDLISRIPNIIINGNFVNGTNSWNANCGTFTVNNGKLILTGNLDRTYMVFSQVTTIPRNLNRKIYMKSLMRTTSNDVRILRLGDANNGEYANSINNPVKDTWYKMSGILKSSFNIGNYRFGAYLFATNINTKSLEAKEFMAIDMGTDSSNPFYNYTVEQMDALFPNWMDKIENTTNFPYTLRSLPDGTMDYIEIDNINKTTKLYKLVGEFQLLDSIAYTLYTYNGLLGVYSSSLLPENYNRVEGVCSHEKRVGTYYAATGTYMWIGVINKLVYWVGILDELNITTVAEFKTWLGQQTANGNTVKGIYKLITPVVTDLDYEEVKTYYPFTQLYTNATIQPNLEGSLKIIENSS